MADVGGAARVLAERGLYGLVWLDDQLVVVARYGTLVKFVRIGAPAQDSLFVLLGFEEQLAALPANPAGSIDIPNVGVDLGGASPLRINVNVFWDTGSRRYIIVVSRILAGADIEVELAQQIRARSIAEAEIAAKSREIEAANAELRRINEDLDEFSSIISHDLKAPLRALRYFTDDLTKAIEAGDVGEARAQVPRFRAQLTRMTGMLTGLLNYSRVGRKEEAASPVETGRLIREIVASFDGTHGLTISIDGSWPRIETPATALDLVLRNLLDNAIKHHDRLEGTVAIEAVDGAASLEIRIRDDGPGIPLTWHEAIFQPFRRVARAAEVDGAGIGLAAVKKTVARLGGTITVASDPARERGTTFIIRWPKRPVALASEQSITQ